MIPEAKQQNEKVQGRRYVVLIDPSFFPVDLDPEEAEQNVTVLRTALKNAGFSIDQSKQGVVLTSEQIDAILPNEYKTNPVARDRFKARFSGKKAYQISLTVPETCKKDIGKILPLTTRRAAGSFISSDENLVRHFGSRIMDAVLYRPVSG